MRSGYFSIGCRNRCSSCKKANWMTISGLDNERANQPMVATIVLRTAVAHLYVEQKYKFD